MELTVLASICARSEAPTGRPNQSPGHALGIDLSPLQALKGRSSDPSSLGRPFRASLLFFSLTQGVALGSGWFAPLGLADRRAARDGCLFWRETKFRGEQEPLPSATWERGRRADPTTRACDFAQDDEAIDDTDYRCSGGRKLLRVRRSCWKGTSRWICLPSPM